jgi:excisionase family DNA binding protein
MKDKELRERFRAKFWDEWYTVEAVARILGVSTSTIYNWRDQGRINMVWEGCWKVYQKDLIEFLVKKNN